MADVEGGVDPEAPLQDVQERGKRIPVPGEALAEHVRRHPLDPGEELDQPVVVLARAGRDRVAAVAGDDRGDAVEAGGGGVGVEGELGIVVGVHVDDARHDDEAVGVDRPPGAREAADVGDEAVADADVGAPHRKPRAVDDGPALDDGVEELRAVGRVGFGVRNETIGEIDTHRCAPFLLNTT